MEDFLVFFTFERYGGVFVIKLDWFLTRALSSFVPAKSLNYWEDQSLIQCQGGRNHPTDLYRSGFLENGTDTDHIMFKLWYIYKKYYRISFCPPTIIHFAHNAGRIYRSEFSENVTDTDQIMFKLLVHLHTILQSRAERCSKTKTKTMEKKKFSFGF